MRTPSLLFACSLLLPLVVACATDEKGATCGLLDGYVTEDDELYCPDPEAPDDCDALVEEIIDAAVRCANGGGIPVTDDQLRAELEARDSLPSCENAVATTSAYNTCSDELSGLSLCNPDGTMDPPESCDGAVLVAG